MSKHLLPTAASAAVLFALSAGLGSAADVAAKASKKAAPAPFFFYSDTQVSYWHEFNGNLPAVTNGVQKDIVSLTHFDAWAYGTNFVNLDLAKSHNSLDVSNNQPVGGDTLADFYGVWRSTLSFNALSHAKPFAVGPIKDVSLYYGADWGTKNNAFAANTRKLVGGLQAAFNVPGFFNVAFAAVKEWNNNGIVGNSQNYHPQWAIETAYMQPLDFTGIPLRFSGFTNVYGPKGPDGFNIDTKTELLTDNRLTLDFGKVLNRRPNWIDVFVGYRYWYNKFGNDHVLEAPSNESTWYAGIAWHAL